MKDSNLLTDIVPGNKIPLYYQVAQVIKQRIRLGQYKNGESLPSVRQLGKDLNVTNSAVFRAVRSLERSGIIQTHHGRDMIVADDKPCEQAAILFGFIHPYEAQHESCRYFLGYVNEAFSSRTNMVLTHTSKNDPQLERESARHLIANGAKGLLLWPTSDNTNARYFEELSKQIPIVLVDRIIPSVELPAVTMNHYSAGYDIAQHLLDTLDRKRLLVLMDNLKIDAYDDMILGLQNAADALGRGADITVERFSALDILTPVLHNDYSAVDQYARKIKRWLQDGSYDALFCNAGQLIDRSIIETGLADAFPDVQLATLCNLGMHTGSRGFSRHHPLQWSLNFAGMISTAADILQEMILSQRRTNKVIRIPFINLN